MKSVGPFSFFGLVAAGTMRNGIAHAHVLVAQENATLSSAGDCSDNFETAFANVAEGCWVYDKDIPMAGKSVLKKFSQIKERTKKIPDKTKIHPLPISNIGAIKLLSSSNSSSPF